MKRKTGSRKTRKTASKPRARTKKSRFSRSTTVRSPAASPTPRAAPVLPAKGCEELEVGDIGGFGSTEELEAHENRCGAEATQFCNACGKRLCNSHYEFLHKDHNTSVQGTSRSINT